MDKAITLLLVNINKKPRKPVVHNYLTLMWQAIKFWSSLNKYTKRDTKHIYYIYIYIILTLSLQTNKSLEYNEHNENAFDRSAKQDKQTC